MKPRLCLFFCDYFQEEVEWLLKSSAFKEVKVMFYHADCDKTCQAPTVLAAITQQAKTDSVIVFSGMCLTAMLKKFANSNLQIEPFEICFELLLPEELLHSCLAEGAHLFTNGMLKQWSQINQRWGFDAASKQSFFTEGTTKLVLITHKQIPADETTMTEVAMQLGLPWEKLEISLDHLAMRVLSVINR